MHFIPSSCQQQDEMIKQREVTSFNMSYRFTATKSCLQSKVGGATDLKVFVCSVFVQASLLSFARWFFLYLLYNKAMTKPLYQNSDHSNFHHYTHCDFRRSFKSLRFTYEIPIKSCLNSIADCSIM